MEPYADKHGDGRQIAYGLSACEACAAWPREAEIVAAATGRAHANDLCSCGFEADERKEIARELRPEDEGQDFQNEIESCSISYPDQKECLRSLALGCILLLESRAGQ